MEEQNFPFQNNWNLKYNQIEKDSDVGYRQGAESLYLYLTEFHFS